MPYSIILPALSAGMEEAIIARWLKPEGAEVRKGECLAEIETDKATMELEAETDGKVGKILVGNGMRAEVGQTIAILLLNGDTLDEGYIAPGMAARAASGSKGVVAASPLGRDPKAEVGEQGDRIKASPLARRIAAAKGVGLAGLQGSGPGGRIVRIDVDRAADNQLATKAIAAPDPAKSLAASAEARGIPAGIGAHEVIPHSSMRRAIARRLLEAKTTVPHFYLNMECDIDALLALRSTVNAGRDAAQRISVNDFVVKASAIALRAVPGANAVWTDEAILRLHDVDIAVAVATEGGLITPIVRQADKKSLGTISAEVKTLVGRARENKLKPEEYQGGGFSVSNLGMYGVSSFAAIINPPQSAILAVGAGQRRPVEKSGELVFATIMNCTLSVDHRSVDGALGAQLLAAFKAAIENPLSILV